MMSIGLHCRLVGRPGRAAALARFLDYIAGTRRCGSRPGSTSPGIGTASTARSPPAPRRSVVQRWRDKISLDQPQHGRRGCLRRRAGRHLRARALGGAKRARAAAVRHARRAARSDDGGGARSARGAAAGVDQGPSRSRRQSRARRHHDGRTPRPSRRAPASTGSRRRNTRAFHRLNAAYREKFGIPFIVCVRRHTKDSILRQFERRLQNDAGAETETALAEIFRIVALRLDQRIEARDRLKCTGGSPPTCSTPMPAVPRLA